MYATVTEFTFFISAHEIFVNFNIIWTIKNLIFQRIEINQNIFSKS